MKPACSKLPFPMPRHEQPLESEKKKKCTKRPEKKQKKIRQISTPTSQMRVPSAIILYAFLFLCHCSPPTRTFSTPIHLASPGNR